MFDNNTKALESFMDYSAMMIAEEGANLEMRSKYKAFQNEFKTEIKTAKALMKSNKHKQAIPHLEKAKKSLANVSKEIDKTDSSFGSYVFGLFTSGIPIIGRQIIGALTGTLPLINLANWVERIKVIIDSCDREGGFSIENLNDYKLSIKQKLMEYEKILDMLISKCKTASK